MSFLRKLKAKSEKIWEDGHNHPFNLIYYVDKRDYLIRT